MNKSTYLGMRPGDLDDKPYAKYWNPDMTELTPAAVQALIQSPAPVEYGFEHKDCNQLLNSGNLAMEAGYTQLDNGQLFVACNTPMPGVSGKMIDWWFAWHNNENERYKLWHPHAHRRAVLKEPTVDKPGLTDKEKYVGNTSYVDEYIGNKMVDIAIQFQDPKSFGLDEMAFAQAGVETAVCANIGVKNSPINVGRLIHLIRKTEDGCEMRSRFWMGNLFLKDKPESHILNKLISIKLLPKLFMKNNDARDLFIHCSMEMAHLASFLPSLYNDYHKE